ncbi:MAG TPA: RidA family protein [Kofleriaceae bacterium]|jgi:enamine deaminase RidA (YjgF/YER057c/UK114 family)
MSTQEITVEGWPPPRGYANGRSGTGRTVHVGGMIGWHANGVLVEGIVAQFALALDNVLAVVRAAGGAPTDIADMTVYVTDLAAYRAARRELGPVWKERLGAHYPAMALLGVAGLVEPGALVEIQATAYVEKL